MQPLTIVHVINGGIGVGGAERMLMRILRAADPSSRRHVVVSILPCDYLDAEMRGGGQTFISLGVRARRGRLGEAIRAAARLRGVPAADLVVGWLSYGNVLGALLAGARRVPFVMNFRGTYRASDLARPVMRATRVLAPRAQARIANSRAAVASLEEAGFGPVAFVPNGFASDEFCPDPALGAVFRRAHGIPAEAFLFGHVGRFHPMKNQAGLVRAALRVLEADDRAHVALVGRGVADELGGLLGPEPASRRVHLLDGMADPRGAYAAFDAYVHNSSWGEGFPNVIAEAMLHAVPIVCSDVAESRAIVGEQNEVVSPGDEEALGAAMMRVLRMPGATRSELGRANRNRIATEFGIARVTSEFDAHFVRAAERR